jgi:hypothetical protein
MTTTADGAVCVGNGCSRAEGLACSERSAYSAECETGLVTEGPIYATGCSVCIISFV